MKLQKICIIRLSAFGDIVLFLPTLNIVKRNFPNAQITWIVGKVEYEMVRNIAGVEFVVYDKKSGFKGALDLHRRLKDRRFDLLLMTQESLRASVLSLMISADVKLGYDKARAKDFQTLFSNRQIDPHEKPHMLENFVDFAKAMGATDLAIEWDLPISDDGKNEARSIVDEPYVLMSPCTNIVRRNWRDWTVEGYSATIDYIYNRYGLITVLTGGKSQKELEFSKAIRSKISAPVIDVVGKTTIQGLLALIKNAKLVIAPDSGPGHMAAMFATPTLSLYAAANPARAAPWGSVVVSRYKDALMKFYGKSVDEVKFGTRVRTPKAMELITVDDVVEKLDLMMKENYANDIDKWKKDNRD